MVTFSVLGDFSCRHEATSATQARGLYLGLPAIDEEFSTGQIYGDVLFFEIEMIANYRCRIVYVEAARF
jgi:hypothetical protein